MEEVFLTICLCVGLLFKARLSKIRLVKFIHEQVFSIFLFFPFVALVVFFEMAPETSSWPWFLIQCFLVTVLILIFIKDKEKEW